MLLLAAEEGDDVERHDLSCVAAADHKASVLAERVERLLEQLAADVLVREVGALIVRQPHDLAHDVLLAVVDAVVHAELGRPLELLVGARSADDRRAGHARQLHCGRADAAAHGVDEDRLARLQTGRA